jgi:hypothetical protein
MSEIPERIEREMFEIRGRMSPDMTDLKRHTAPKVVGQRVSGTIKSRIKGAVSGLGKSIAASARRQARAAGEAGREKDPSRFTSEVKSDPRPLVILALIMTISLMMVRKVTNGRD